MEQNPDELEVTPVVEVTESAPKQSAPKRPRTRVPKAALAKIEEAQNEERARETTVLEEPKPVPKVPDNQILKCECGCDIMPEANGLYPSRCPECGTWNDYRGVKFLEQSANILVCDKCGGLTLIKPDTVCCEHCGAR